MKGQTGILRTLSLLLLATALGLLLYAPAPSRVSIQTRSTGLERLDLAPGQSAAFTLGGDRIILRIPAGPEEAASSGTFQIRQADGPFRSGPLPRDGSVESVLVHDADRDGRDDATVVVRNAGSGSYVSLFTLRSGPEGYSISPIPEPPATLLQGYQGHDSISVAEGAIVRRFPTYVDRDRIRMDRQWSPGSLVRDGAMPVKRRPDSNTSPSGRDRRLVFHFATRTWTED